MHAKSLALALMAASPAYAGTVPQQIQGRWTDGTPCAPAGAPMVIKSDTLESWLADVRQGAVRVDAKGDPATRLELRITMVLATDNGHPPVPGDVFVVRLDAGKLRLLETSSRGRTVKAKPSDPPLQRCE